MRSLLRLIVFLVVLFLAACAGTESTPTESSATESSPTEGALRQRAEAASEAANSASLRAYPDDAYRDVYRFMTREFRKQCTRDM